MHIALRTGDRCFKVTAAGLTLLMCDCITNAFYLMIILVSGDHYFIITNFILYFGWL